MAEEFDREITREIADLMQTALWGIEIERDAKSPVVTALLADLRQRAKDALDLLLEHDMWAPDFTDLARSCIGDIRRHRDTVEIIAKTIADGLQAHRMLREAERRE